MKRSNLRKKAKKIATSSRRSKGLKQRRRPQKRAKPTGKDRVRKIPVPAEPNRSLSTPFENLIAAPGGHRSKLHVHKVTPGHTIRIIEGRFKEHHPKKGVVGDLGPSANATATPATLNNYWVAYSQWQNNIGSPISLFKTTWVVPQPPKTIPPGQLIYLFSGIQNSTCILQPVLQWGTSPSGGGNNWAIGSWYAGSLGEPAFCSDMVQVNPGDILTGTIAMTGQAKDPVTGQFTNSFNYSCQFAGYPATSLNLENIEELTLCVETLEAHGITNLSDYPAAPFTAFTSINIQTGTPGTPGTAVAGPAWTISPVTPNTGPFGEYCAVKTPASANQVNIYY